MARLRVLSGWEVCRILAAHGFAEVRRRGSHVVMQKSGAGGTVTWKSIQAAVRYAAELAGS